MTINLWKKSALFIVISVTVTVCLFFGKVHFAKAVCFHPSDYRDGVIFRSEEDVYVKIVTENKSYDILYGDVVFCQNEVVYYDAFSTAKKIADDFYVPPVDSRFVYNDGKIEITNAVCGKKIDEVKLAEDIASCLSAGGGMVVGKSYAVTPKYTKKDLKNNTSLRAEFSTSFSGSNTARVGNVLLATKKASGITLYPNEVFSFNDAVGVRSEENGFKEAKVIVGGKYVDGVGGGVCQVSTTLYNAALLSGLSVVEQHRHTLAVNYVEKSFDAMVSYGYADLKIRNDYDFPVFIVGKVDGETLTFRIYGDKMTEKIQRQSVILKTVEPDFLTVFTDELKKGESKVSVYPKKGYESEGYLIKTENGVTRRVLLRKDEYKKVDGVTEVGR